MRRFTRPAHLAAGVALSLLMVVAAQPQGSAGAPAPPASGGIPGVQLTQQQQERVAAIRRETRADVERIRRNTRLSPADREARIEAARRAGHLRVMAQLTPEQQARFRRWWEERTREAGALGLPAGAAEPGGGVPGVTLSDEQRQRVLAIRREAYQRVQEIGADEALTDDQKAQRIAEARQSSHDRVLAVLTPAQRAQFERWWRQRQTGPSPEAAARLSVR